MDNEQSFSQSFLYDAVKIQHLAIQPVFQISPQITQYSCTFSNLAPEGCTQYYYGSTTGSVNSFNYQSGNGAHLANQDQTICVRTEANTCR